MNEFPSLVRGHNAPPGSSTLPMSQCPSPDDLDSLLSDSLTGQLGEKVRAHVRTCARCQALLDTKSDDPQLSPWAGRASLLDSDDEFPEIDQLLNSLRDARFPRLRIMPILKTRSGSYERSWDLHGKTET